MDRTLESSELSALHPRKLREMCRSGAFRGPTAGLAPGYVQANLVVLAEDLAGDFKRFCELNPGPCPLLEVTDSGVYEPRCAQGADLRTDLPRYRVYRHGELINQPTDILSCWPDRTVISGPSVPNHHITTSPHHHINLVAFLLGCSFTFESALLRAGIPVRHIEQKCNVPMYRTNIPCKPSGIFSGPMVVSMRPMTLAQAGRARELTASMPGSHGAPVHVGDPGAIGIEIIERPHYGDPVEVRSGEIPVFWACGVTPLETILRARPELAIVHEPGHMFVTDLESAEAVTSD